MYRFTWYGFYVGADIAYLLDYNWTLFSELECHFLDNCHRKRHSRTGVHFVDHYHHKGWAYGFNALVGAAFQMSDCWYATFTVEYKRWKSDSDRSHDILRWQTVSTKAGIGYSF
jgi:opacity protein-like surface antigen